MSVDSMNVNTDAEMTEEPHSIPSQAVESSQNSNNTTKVVSEASESAVYQKSPSVAEIPLGTDEALPFKPEERKESERLDNDVQRCNGDPTKVSASDVKSPNKRNRPKEKTVVSSLQGSFQHVGEDSAGNHYWFDGEKCLYQGSKMHPNGLAGEVTLICKSARQWTSKHKELSQQSHPKDTQLAQLMKNHYLPLVRKAISQKDKPTNVTRKPTDGSHPPKCSTSTTKSKVVESDKVASMPTQMPTFNPLQQRIPGHPQGYYFVISTPMGPQIVMNPHATGHLNPAQGSSHHSLTSGSESLTSPTASVSSERKVEQKSSSVPTETQNTVSFQPSKSLSTGSDQKSPVVKSPAPSHASQHPQPMYCHPPTPYSIHTDPKSGQSYFVPNQGSMLGQPYALMQLPDGRYVQVPSTPQQYQFQQHMESQRSLYQMQMKNTPSSHTSSNVVMEKGLKPPSSDEGSVQADVSKKPAKDAVGNSEQRTDEAMKSPDNVSVRLPSMSPSAHPSSSLKCYKVAPQEPMVYSDSPEPCIISKQVNPVHSSSLSSQPLQQFKERKTTKPEFEGKVGERGELATFVSLAKVQGKLPSKHRRKQNPIKSHSPSPEVILPIEKEDKKRACESQLALFEKRPQLAKEVDNESSLIQQAPDPGSPTLNLESPHHRDVSDSTDECAEKDDIKDTHEACGHPNEPAVVAEVSEHSDKTVVGSESGKDSPISPGLGSKQLHLDLKVSIERKVYDLLHQNHKGDTLLSPVLSECSSLAESYTEPLPPLEKVDLDTLSEITRDSESSNMQPPRAKRRCVAMREEMQKLHKLLGNHGAKEQTRKRIPSRRSSVRQSHETAGNCQNRSTSSQTKDDKVSHADEDIGDKEDNDEDYDMNTVYVFSSRMANLAAKAVADEKFESITKWHVSQLGHSTYLKPAIMSPSYDPDSIAAKFSNKPYSSSLYMDCGDDGESDADSSKKSSSSDDDDDSSDGETESERDTSPKALVPRTPKEPELLSPTLRYGAKQLLFAAEGRTQRIPSKPDQPKPSSPTAVTLSPVNIPSSTCVDSSMSSAVTVDSTVSRNASTPLESSKAVVTTGGRSTGQATFEEDSNLTRHESDAEQTDSGQSPKYTKTTEAKDVQSVQSVSVQPPSQPSSLASMFRGHNSQLANMLPPSSAMHGTTTVLPMQSSPYVADSFRSQQPVQVAPLAMRPNTSVPMGAHPYVGIRQFPYQSHPQPPFTPQYHADQGFSMLRHNLPPVPRLQDPNWAAYPHQYFYPPPYLPNMRKTPNTTKSTSRTS